MINVNANGSAVHPHPATTTTATASLVSMSSQSSSSNSSSSSSSTHIALPVGAGANDAPVFVASAGASDELFSSKINYIVNRVSYIYVTPYILCYIYCLLIYLYVLQYRSKLSMTLLSPSTPPCHHPFTLHPSVLVLVPEQLLVVIASALATKGEDGTTSCL